MLSLGTSRPLPGSCSYPPDFLVPVTPGTPFPAVQGLGGHLLEEAEPQPDPGEPPRPCLETSRAQRGRDVSLCATWSEGTAALDVRPAARSPSAGLSPAACPDPRAIVVTKPSLPPLVICSLKSDPAGHVQIRVCRQRQARLRAATRSGRRLRWAWCAQGCTRREASSVFCFYIRASWFLGGGILLRAPSSWKLFMQLLFHPLLQ